MTCGTWAWSSQSLSTGQKKYICRTKEVVFYAHMPVRKQQKQYHHYHHHHQQQQLTKPLANHWLTREPAYRPSPTGRTASLCQPPVSESLSRSQFRPLSLDSKTKNEVYSNTAIHIVLKIMLKTNPFQCRNWDWRAVLCRAVSPAEPSVCVAAAAASVSVTEWVR